MADVVPLVPDPRGRVGRRAPAAGTRPLEQAPLEPGPVPDDYAGHGVDRREIRRLRRGQHTVSGRLDLKALARALGASKAAMADVKDAERATGYVAGGISPFGQKRAHRTVVDETVELWDTVYVSGGRRGLDVGIAPADLVEVTGAIRADISSS